MTSKPTESQREVIDNLRLDVGIIKDQMIGLRESNKAILSKVENFTYAKQSDVEKLATVAEKVETRITILEQKMKPIEKIYYLILGTLITGIIGLGFFLIQKAIT